MTTVAQIYAACDNKNVCFHIGRGGRFHNAGHKTFNPYTTRIQDCFGEADIISEDEEGRELPADQWQLIDGGGDVILAGRDEIESETGTLDWDGEYDTDIVKPVSDCTDGEYALILKAWSEYELSVDEDVVRYAAVATGTPMLERMTFDGATLRLEMYGFKENVTLNREDFDGTDPEDELRGELHYYDFLERDIERIMEAVSDECWFDDEED